MNSRQRSKKSYFAVAVLLAFGSFGTLQLAAQTQEVPGSQLADRAYQELTAKNYQGAIDNFNAALFANPSNSRWRKDLGYAYKSADKASLAVREFQVVFKDNPQDLMMALELGYLSEGLHNEGAAEAYYKQATASADEDVSKPARVALANLQAAQVWARKKQAFDLLAENRRTEATSLFEKLHEADPTDGATTLQLGYIYLDAGETQKARQMFVAGRTNQNPEIALRARQGLSEVDQRTARWFTSMYASSSFQSRFSNTTNVLNAKSGMKVGFLEPYVGMRFARDTRSKAGILPEIYSDNSAVIGGGLQSRIPASGITLYAEAGAAFDMLAGSVWKNPKQDYRGGADWFAEWGESIQETVRNNSSGFSMIGSGYSDVSYYTRYNHNVIGYLQFRQGVNLPTTKFLPMQVLAAVNGVKDSKKAFYNNIVEVAPVIRIAPIRPLPDFQIEAQYVRGYYVLRNDGTNPYGSNYEDFRVTLTWGTAFRW
jgi:tetratricopeptide (TPR) repeat protein